MSALATIRFAIATSRLGAVTRFRPACVAGLQQRRLRRLLRLTVSRSTFYRDKYRGIDLSHAALAELPVTKQSELASNFDRVITDPCV